MSKEVEVKLSPEEIALIQEALFEKVTRNLELQSNNVIYKSMNKALSDLSLKFLDLRKKNPCSLIEFVLSDDFKITAD